MGAIVAIAAGASRWGSCDGCVVVRGRPARTDFLVVGGKPGSKADKAAELGVEVLVEEDFLARLQSD